MSNDANNNDDKTRISTGNDVNPSAKDKVNNPETGAGRGAEKKRPNVIHKIGAGTSAKPGSGTDEGSDFVPTETKSIASQKEQRSLALLSEAQAAARAFDRIEAEERDHKKSYKQKKTFEGRRVVKSLLRFVEELKNLLSGLDDEAVERFFDQHDIGEKHGGIKNKWYRLSFHCASPGTSKPLITKRANGLRIIIERGIRSEDLDAEFEKEEKVGPKKTNKSGLEKYVAIHDDLYGDPRQPRKKGGEYTEMEALPLLKEVDNILGVVHDRSMISDAVLAALKKELSLKIKQLEEAEAN